MGMMAPHYVEALHRVKQLIEQHTVTPLSYPQLCQKVRISEDVLVYGFRELFQTSPYQYYLDVKFSEIEQLLRDTEDTMATISNSMGYEHVSSFVSAFKKDMGARRGSGGGRYEKQGSCFGWVISPLTVFIPTRWQWPTHPPFFEDGFLGCLSNNQQ